MKIYKLTDKEFLQYGKVLTAYDTKQLIDKLDELTPMPIGIDYVQSQEEFEKLAIADEFINRAYGGMPIQIGWCNGHNTKLNCLEYHKDSELNIGADDYILLLAKQEDIIDSKLDTSTVKAFYVPAATVVEIYATTLHYAPCSAKKGQGFKVVVVLPQGTNGAKPSSMVAANIEDSMLWARNKWLLAHAESEEAKQGAVVALIGDNIAIDSYI